MLKKFALEVLSFSIAAIALALMLLQKTGLNQEEVTLENTTT